MFMAKGGGSANKSYLFQETKALLNPQSLAGFLDEKLRALGTAACPPYHLAIVVGGTSAEFAVETAKLGGKYFCHDVRVIRLPRHGASCPVALAVSCSADRQALAKITHDGVFLEQLEHDPARFLPEIDDTDLGTDVVRIDLSRPMAEIRAELSRYPVKTRLSLSGPMVVARDIAHA